MGLLAHALSLRGPTHGRPTCSSLSCPGDMVPMVPKLITNVPTIQCNLGHFKVHYALCDFGASMNIMPKTVYDCLDGDPLILVSWCLELADSTKIQHYGMVKDVLI
jgi:hypothetical protein